MTEKEFLDKLNKELACTANWRLASENELASVGAAISPTVHITVSSRNTVKISYGKQELHLLREKLPNFDAARKHLQEKAKEQAFQDFAANFPWSGCR